MKLVYIIATAALALASTAANAGIAFFGGSPGNFTYAVATFAPINGSATSVLLKPTKPTRYAITYSAECGATNSSGVAGNFNGWNTVLVYVDGAVVSPLSTSAAFCSVSSSNPSIYEWVRGSVTVGVVLSAGTHTVQVQGSPQSGTTTGWLGDSALVIQN